MSEQVTLFGLPTSWQFSIDWTFCYCWAADITPYAQEVIDMLHQDNESIIHVSDATVYLRGVRDCMGGRYEYTFSSLLSKTLHNKPEKPPLNKYAIVIRKDFESGKKLRKSCYGTQSTGWRFSLPKQILRKFVSTFHSTTLCKLDELPTAVQ